MTLDELANRGSCGGGSGSLGGNQSKGCPIDLSNIKSIWPVTLGTRILPTDDISVEDFWTNLIVEGKMKILDSVLNFIEEGSDDAVETDEDDTQTVTNEGKYLVNASYRKGLYNNKVLHSIKGNGTWAFILIDKNGNMLLTESTNSQAKGITAGMVQPMKLQWATTTTGLKQALRIQFLEREEIDSNYVFISSANLGFNPLLKRGVAQTAVKFVTAPANAATTVRVSVVLDQDQKTPVEDLALPADFNLQVAGATKNIDTVAAVAGQPGQYDLTFTGGLNTNEAITVAVYDTANNRSVVNKNGNLYQSATLSGQVV